MTAFAPERGDSALQFLSDGNRNRSSIQSNDLTPWVPSSSQPWDVHTINHLYRRAGFGATLGEIAAAKGKSVSDVVDGLLDSSLLTAPTTPAIPGYSDSTNLPPSWLHVPPSVYNDPTKQLNDYALAVMKIRCHWTVQMDQPLVSLREKMVLFLMNHFVIEAKKVIWPQFCYTFLTYMRQNAWGNFKKMVSDVTTLPAMLNYLDGLLNKGTSPNENYARELQELFTMGILDKNGNPNYTQFDIEAMAKVLSGWTIDYTAPPPNILPSLYDKSNHNETPVAIYDGVSRIYNLTASGDAFMQKDLIDQMFEQRGDQIAWFICSKLYQFFVYHDISGASELAVIDAMAALLKSSNWELKPVISALLKSAHFFDESNIGAQIKSPYDHLIGLLRTFEIPIDELASGTLYYYAAAGAQVLLDPPNVKGWTGYHSWISTTTLPLRNAIQTGLVSSGTLPSVGGSDGYNSTNLYTSILLSDQSITAWGKKLANYSGHWDDLVVEVANYLCAQPPSATAINYIKAPFGPNISYEWSVADDSAKILGLRQLAKSIMLLADFQLS
jgi:uncharacterized protein (DUF1800 family)